jgi:hypothetical protein
VIADVGPHLGVPGIQLLAEGCRHGAGVIDGGSVNSLGADKIPETALIDMTLAPQVVRPADDDLRPERTRQILTNHKWEVCPTQTADWWLRPIVRMRSEPVVRFSRVFV